MPQRIEKTTKPSIAAGIFPNLAKPEDQTTKRAPFDGWAPQRATQWDEDDQHRARGFMSPLGGAAKPTQRRTSR